MKISPEILSRLKNEANASLIPATEDQLKSLQTKNLKDKTLEYFATTNIAAEKDLVYIENADGVLQLMEDIDPNCEVWQHGYIGFCRDFEGRTYCFDQNILNKDNEPRIIRYDYPWGENPSPEDLSNSAEVISETFADFLERYLNNEFA